MAAETQLQNFTLCQLQDAFGPYASDMLSASVRWDLGHVPEYIRSRFDPAGNDDLMSGLKAGWYDTLSPHAKDSCLREMLAVPAVAALADASRDEWLRIVAACARSRAPAAREICRTWSQTSRKYDFGAFERDFTSFEAAPGDIGVATLIHHAIEGGFTSDRYRALSDTRQDCNVDARGEGATTDVIGCIERFRMSKTPR